MKKKALAIAFIVFLSTFSLLNSGCKKASDRTNYSIDCTLDGYTLNGVQTVDFFNSTENTICELKFNIYANAFRQGAKYSPIGAQYLSRAYPNGLSYGEFIVNGVTLHEESADFKIEGVDKNVLTIPLKEEIFPEERVSVTIDYTINLANVIARTGYNADTINLANFYPILCGLDENGFYECAYYSAGDPYFSDCSDYTVTLSCEEKYTVASSGKLVSANSQNGKTQRKYELNNARSFALVLSEKFEAITQEIDGLQLNYYFYDDENPNESFEYIKKSIKYFNQTFGEYPYSTYSVVQTQFIQGGMEFPALVMISDDLEKNAYGEVIVHETAHQWWQTCVGNNEIEYGFVDEGLTEYSVVLFYENHPEYKMTRTQMITSSENTYKVFCSVYDKIFGGVNTTMIRSLDEFTNEYEYVNISYIKPCIMYDYLRKTIGDEMFFKGLKNYFSKYCFKNVTPYEVVGVYEKLGAGTNGFFESFYQGKVII